MAETSSTGENRMTMPEKLQLHGFDHPGMVLVSAPLTGNNYLNWSFGVKRALSAKMKLGFIDGTSIKPNANHPHFEQWIRVDSMVTTWILNSISKDIVEAFMYTKSSRNLWLDLEQRYGECNGPQLYQLQREICSMTQGTTPLSSYFTNIKKLWDEMSELKPVPQCTCHGCTCGASKAMTDMASFTQLMQFLMGLVMFFYSVRHQLLVMDPVPSINKAYAMVQSVEKQRQVHMELSESTESAALHVTARKLVLKSMVRRTGTYQTYENWFSYGFSQGNFAQSDDFAGMNGVFAGYGNNILTSWIVDTGATNHMCASACILTNVSPLPNLLTSVHLPDGNTQSSYPISNSLHPFPVTQPAVPTSSDTHIPLRRSQRTTSKPSWLNDYECNCISSNDSCIPSSYSAAHLSFVAHLSSLQEPKDYLQASKDSNWVAAMNKELEALKANDTWILTSLPPGKQTIGSRWVFKLKLNPDGSVECYKARLVTKGYNQIEGVDYFDTALFNCPYLLALAVSRSWPLLQFDVNNAFLHGSLDEDVYMEPPQGFVGAAPGQVCKLQKSLYGLKQASRQWNLELMTKFLDFGFSQSTHEHCLFIKSSDSEFTALLVYVDDILLTGNSESAMYAVRDYLDDLFTIKDLGQAKYFLGLELARSSHGLQVSQHKYLQDILADTSMLAAKLASTPFPLGLKLVLEDGALLPNPNKYRRLIGRLLSGVHTPRYFFRCPKLSQFLQAPRTSHWDAALHVLRYLKGTPTILFFSSSSSSQLTAYSDASWASCLDSRRSITGLHFFGHLPRLLEKLKNRPQFPRSSAEAEYRSMASTVCELLWITYLLRDFGVSVSLPIPFWCDNQAALHITANPVFHERTKHLDIDCHLVRDQFKLGFIAPSHISGSAQLADLFTKSLPVGDFIRFLSKMGLFSHVPS
ncbi:Retrovirus-related Pol polyprotein from transposon RE2 [Sesamum angolense]|uniref:Retrovirus-related Pol polyprotein from transposon RE2 n=1 Tax=Sesamum angolense TaxID=2727404 RepID=A0AAE2BMD9_9LAMI|nr:Retrovirus-related Pol polyprotein from transposon RE2 [Sesamum angolense]